MLNVEYSNMATGVVKGEVSFSDGASCWIRKAWGPVTPVGCFWATIKSNSSSYAMGPLSCLSVTLV